MSRLVMIANGMGRAADLSFAFFFTLIAVGIGSVWVYRLSRRERVGWSVRISFAAYCVACALIVWWVLGTEDRVYERNIRQERMPSR
jgi:hypothetical protein